MMNGHAGGRDIRAMMMQLARENGERVKMALMRFGGTLMERASPLMLMSSGSMKSW